MGEAACFCLGPTINQELYKALQMKATQHPSPLPLSEQRNAGRRKNKALSGLAATAPTGAPCRGRGSMVASLERGAGGTKHILSILDH